MRYTCLDVRSPDVNFLRKVMSSSRHDGAAYSRHPCRQSADADIVSAFPLPFSTFLENINILRQTSSTWHRIFREFCVLESFQKPVAPAGIRISSARSSIRRCSRGDRLCPTGSPMTQSLMPEDHLLPAGPWPPYSPGSHGPRSGPGRPER